MKAYIAVAIAGIGLLIAATPLLAHHSFAAEFDASRPVTLKGVVTRIEWTNPHAHVFLEVKGDQGLLTNWKLEMGSPTVLVTQCGWTARTLHVGDEVTVEGAQAKDGTNVGNAKAVILAATGKRLFAARAETDTPQQR